VDGHVATSVTGRSKFFQELSEGQSDVVILPAHSTRSEFFLNGEKITVKELQNRPARVEKSSRPRLAVLLACDAGKVNSGSSDALTRFVQRMGFKEELSPLGADPDRERVR
jgi:hypothetical protein